MGKFKGQLTFLCNAGKNNQGKQIEIHEFNIKVGRVIRLIEVVNSLRQFFVFVFFFFLVFNFS